MTEVPNPANLTADPTAGLEGIVVAHTSLSDVDGQNGVLTLRGKRIEDLAGALSFEEAIAHLWNIGETSSISDLQSLFGLARHNAFAVIPVLEAASCSMNVYDSMMLGLTALPLKEDLPDMVAICGALPVFLAAAHRISQGAEPLFPDGSLETSTDLLRMLSARMPEPYQAAALNRYLVTILDHGLNASTFAARVIGSTKAGLKSSILGAMAALSGPLHGGAPGPVLDMIDAIGSPDNADSWINEALTRKERLMGFGHRIYRTRDPRADVLKEGVKLIGTRDPKVRLAEDIEVAALKALRKAKPNRTLDTNVEFYTAVLLDAIGLDRTLFTPLFATGRAPGWCAHVLEQQSTGKLIRPASVYVGPEAE